MLLFDLTTRDGARPSPYCWRAKLVLRHKGLPYDEKACTYSDIRTIGDGSFKTVPVIQDGGDPADPIHAWFAHIDRIATA